MLGLFLLRLPPTLAGMLGAPLVGHQVVQMGEPAQKRLLAAFGMMEALHHEQLPVDGVMGLIHTVLVTGICGSSRTAYQPVFFSWNQRRTRSRWRFQPLR